MTQNKHQKELAKKQALARVLDNYNLSLSDVTKMLTVKAKEKGFKETEGLNQWERGSKILTELVTAYIE